MNQHNDNIALLIDSDNASHNGIDPVLTALAELGTVNIRRAYGNMSSDSDFMPLAMRIRQEGLPVYGFGSAKTPEGFRQACSRFIDVDALIKADKRNRSSARSDVKAATKPEVAPGNGDSSGGKVDDELLNLLIDAYQATKRDAEGYASLSEVGKIAGNRSSFDVRNYGFSRLSEMFEAVPNFQTKRDDHGHLFVKRLR